MKMCLCVIIHHVFKDAGAEQHSVIQGQSPPLLEGKKTPPPSTFPTPGSPGS